MKSDPAGVCVWGYVWVDRPAHLSPSNYKVPGGMSSRNFESQNWTGVWLNCQINSLGLTEKLPKQANPGRQMENDMHLMRSYLGIEIDLFLVPSAKLSIY